MILEPASKRGNGHKHSKKEHSRRYSVYSERRYSMAVDANDFPPWQPYAIILVYQTALKTFQ